MPTATDLVTDLPADFEVFGQAVDTDFVDLLGGTTGQVLSKTSATDLDFTWVTAQVGDITGVTAGTGITGGGTSGTVTVTNDMATTITAAGDIVVGTGSGTYDNLPIGTTAQVLTADTTVSPYKVKWATPAGGGKVLQVVMGTTTTTASNSTTTPAATNLTANITPSLATSKVLVIASQNGCATLSSANNALQIYLYRGSTDITSWFGRVVALNYVTKIATMSIAYLDSPATTSPTTYSTKFNNYPAAASVVCQENAELSTIILMEIGA